MSAKPKAPPNRRLTPRGMLVRRELAWLGIGLLLAFELAWLGYYLAVTLPNAKNVGGDVKRWILLAVALPGLVPGIGFRDSHIGGALGELSHVENLPQRLPIAGAGLLIAGAGAGLGLLILRALRLSSRLRLVERLPLAFGLGSQALALLTLGLGRLGLLAPWPIRLGLAAGLAGGLFVEVRAGLRADRSALPPPPDDERPLGPGAVAAFALAAGPFVLIMALASMLPTTDFDSLAYHLQAPKEWYAADRVGFLPHNVYASMPFGVEMLHLLGMVVLGDWWRGGLVGQFVVMLHAPAAAAFIGLAARQCGSPRAGLLAALIYLATPWVYRLAAIPYVEGPLAFYHAALLWAVVWEGGTRVADRGRKSDPPHPASGAVWGVVGALAGGAMACKYPGLISAVVPFGGAALVAAVRRRSWASVLGFGVGLAVVIGPWLAKNVVDTGNPVYPLAFGVFGGRGWDADREAKWSRAHGPRSINAKELADGLLDVAGRNDWQSPLYTALAPLALLRPGRRSRGAAAWLWAYVAYLFATWWLLTHRLDRFWLPLLPAAAVLAGLGADWSRRLGWSIALGLILTVSIFTTFVYDSTALAGLNQWTDDLDRLRAEVPAMASPSLARLDAALPDGAKVLLFGQAGAFHMRHPVAYFTVFNDDLAARLVSLPPDAFRRALADRGITHVFVDWAEIERYRSPGNYGYTPDVSPAAFDRLAAAGVLERLEWPTPDREYYRVRP